MTIIEDFKQRAVGRAEWSSPSTTEPNPRLLHASWRHTKAGFWSAEQQPTRISRKGAYHTFIRQEASAGAGHIPPSERLSDPSLWSWYLTLVWIA